MQNQRIVLGLAAVLVMAVDRELARAQMFSVPGDFPTIQSAIEAAPEGSRIQVAAGIHRENLDFLGKALVVEGTGADSVIDGGSAGPVVRFVSGEGSGSVLDSFTITGGMGSTGGGIEIRDSSPTVLRNIIQANAATSSGSGIYIGGSAAAPAIFNNLLIFNTGVGGGDPHTIQVAGSAPRIINNTIMRNDSNAVFTSGGAVAEIRNNILARNGSSGAGQGRKGRGICDFASGTVTQYNLFFRNRVSALLTGGKDYRRIGRAQKVLARPALLANVDGRPRFSGGRVPRHLEEATPDRFVPRTDRNRPSRTIGAGDPSPAFLNPDGSRNTIGFTGGPWAASD